MMFASLLLLIGVTTGLGVEPKVRQLSEPTYNFNRETFLYDQLAFGSTDAMLRFMSNQVVQVQIGIYQQDGSGGFDMSIDPYPFDRDEETFEEFVVRTSNTEFQRVIALKHYRIDQKFSMGYYFEDECGKAQFYNKKKVEFIPQQSGSAYVVPNSIIDSLSLQMVSGIGGTQMIAWDRLKRATLRVFDENGNVVYAGDSLKNPLNDDKLWVSGGVTSRNWNSLVISRKFVTRSYTGVLTVSTYEGTSGTYQLKDGAFVHHPQEIPPLIGLSTSNGQSTVSVNGAPSQSISLLCYSNLNISPHEEILTLDDTGSMSWTNRMQSMHFFKVQYPYAITSQKP